MPTKIRIKPQTAPKPAESPTAIWTPDVGNSTKSFLQHLSELGRSRDVLERIKKEAVGVLGACSRPTSKGTRTGLVLGRVQSGKTSSFTAVSALAHDNGFKIVIVIAGTTQLLVEQTTERLERDLRLTASDAYKRWTACPISDRSKPKAEAAKSALRARLKALCATGEPIVPGIPLVVVMKNAAHLDQLNALLKEAKDVDNLDLRKLPTLIIDDEAHMHSPNVGKDERANASTIYSAMRALLSKFERCSLLQYTATPQANLLMEIQSELSPEFVRVLEPGPGYIGGHELFGVTAGRHVRSIPETDYPDDAKETDPAPKSLIAALANFLLVCAIDFRLKGEALPHSLLVHSDVKTAVHKVFEHWIKTTLESWEHLVPLTEGGRSVPGEFLTEWADLDRTLNFEVNNVKFDNQLRQILCQVMTNVRVQTVNSKNDVGKVNFNQSPYWIINGGNILGVGYTIEGLVTTHMMRKPGGGMADTIQQRGRFFGYRKPQLDEIRLFITSEMAKRFKDYADHEDGLRNSLAAFDASHPRYISKNGTLKDWKRLFWLDPAMIPTRRKAQRLVLERAQIESDGWLPQKYMTPTDNADLENRGLIDALVGEIERANGGWKVSGPWGGEDGADSTHREAEITVERLLSLLAEYTFPAPDQDDMSTAMLAIDTKHASTEHVTVIQMSVAPTKAHAKANHNFRRFRSVGKDGSIELFQGRGKGPGGYVGDRKVHSDRGITLQIYSIDLFHPTGKRAGTSGTEAFRVRSPILAVRLPKKTREWASNILKQQ